MDSVHKIEGAVAKWFKDVPHLPAEAQKWLADNAWWLVIIGIVLGGVGIFSLLSVVLLAGLGLGLAGGALAGGAGAAAGLAFGGFVVLITLATLAVSVIELVIMIMSVSPLKARRKKGWDLLFLLAVINVVTGVVFGLLSMNLMGIILGILWSAVGAYFLFEIRSHFEGAKPAAKKIATKKAA